MVTNMADLFFATVQDSNSVYEYYEGTRDEITGWINDRYDLERVGIFITNERGVVVGRKMHGEPEIAWDLRGNEG